MDLEPADYVCLECSLRFKNSGSFEKHKRKFCQGQGRSNINTWAPSSKSNRRISNDQPEYPLKTASGADFWAGKPVSERLVLSSPAIYQAADTARRPTSNSYGSLNQINAGMKFSSVLEDLQLEKGKLEEHKRAIQEKLARIHENGGSTDKQSKILNEQANQQFVQKERKERNAAMEAHLEDLQNSILRYQHPSRHNGGKEYYLHPSSSEDDNTGLLLAHIRKLKRRYMEDGGDDVRIFEMFHGLESDIYRNRQPSSRSKHYGNREKESEMVQLLQKQLQTAQQTNESLMKELQILKASRERHREYRSNQVGERSVPNIDIGNFHEKKLMEMRQEAEIYRQQLELERLKNELQNLRGPVPNLPQLPAIQYNQSQQQHSLVMSEKDMYHISNEKTEEAFQPAPYDPGSGFAIFWDFICGITQATDQCRIVVTMFKESEAVSDSKVLPAVPCSPSNDNAMPYARYSGRIAILGIKQIFPRCLPLQSLTVVVQVQMGSQRDVVFEAMQEVGWSQVNIFDSFSQVIAGRWKVPVRVPPVAPQLTAAQLNAVQQLDGCELYYRLINARDVESQEGLVLASQQTKAYKYPHLDHKVVPLSNVSLEPRRPIISSADSPPVRTKTKAKRPKTPDQSPEPASPLPVSSPPIRTATSRRDPTPKPAIPTPAALPVRNPTPKHPSPISEPSPQQELHEIPSENEANDKYFLGFQFDKLYDVHEATARLQITIFGGNGKVAKSESASASKRTLYCRTPFLKSVLAFALREVQFAELTLDAKSFVIIEVYTTASGGFLAVTQSEDDPEELACWTFMPLCQPFASSKQASRNSRMSKASKLDEIETYNQLKANTGMHEVGLYSPPVLEPRQILSGFKNPQIFDSCEQFGSGYITFFVFNKQVLPPALPSDLPVVSSENECPESAWVPSEQKEPPETPYKNGDGFELYIDAGRFFPDNCAFVKVLCQLYDNKYTKLKDEYDTDIDLDLNPYNPTFDLKFEFREFSYPPTTTILFKVFIIDSVTRQAFRLGMAVLPVFVKPGTFDRADDLDSKFCLNDGCFQLKLYNELKNVDRLTRSAVESPVPCASLLVRVLRAPCYPDGQPKQASDFLEDQWESEGLLVPKPKYTEGVYESKECKPSLSECRLLHAYLNRKSTSTREAMKLITEGRKSKNDQGLIDTVKNLLKNCQNCPKADLMYLAKYSSKHGVVISVDNGQNLPWAGFTFATYCFSPPASFYKGKLDDPAVLVTKLDLDGSIRLPKWADGIKVFPRRRSHSNLVVIVHIYEVVLSQKEGRVEFSFGAQAWTVVPVCYQEYTYHGLFQVGIFHDAPSNAIIDQIQNEPLAQTITNLRRKKIIKLVDGASVFIRIGDARRREELEDPSKLTVRKTFLPRGNKYLNVAQSKRFATIIPPDQNAEEYGKVLASKFRMLAGQAFQFRIPK